MGEGAGSKDGRGEGAGSRERRGEGADSREGRCEGAGSREGRGEYAGRLTVVPDYCWSIANITEAMFNGFPVFCSYITVVTGNVAQL